MTARLLRHAAVLAVVAAAALLHDGRAATAAGCWSAWVTGYLETGNPTADGTPTAGQAWSIAAAHPSVPFGTLLAIDGVGVVRIADRGLLAENEVDVLVDSVASALALTGEYRVCER